MIAGKGRFVKVGEGRKRGILAISGGKRRETWQVGNHARVMHLAPALGKEVSMEIRCEAFSFSLYSCAHSTQFTDYECANMLATSGFNSRARQSFSQEFCFLLRH